MFFSPLCLSLSLSLPLSSHAFPAPGFLATHIRRHSPSLPLSILSFKEFPCVKGKMWLTYFPPLKSSHHSVSFNHLLMGLTKSLPGWKRDLLLTPMFKHQAWTHRALYFYRVLNCRSPSPFLYSFFFFFFLSFGRHQQMIPWCIVPWAWKNFSYLKTGRPAASYQGPQACQEKHLLFFRPKGKSGHRMGALAVNSLSPGWLCFLDSLVFLDQLICLSGEEKRKQKQINHTSEELSWNPRRISWQWSS